MKDKIMETEGLSEIYALIDDIAKLYEVFEGKAVQNGKLSYGHRKLLMCLAHGEETDQVLLIQESNLTSSAVSSELSGMEAKGYVRRREDPADRRRTLVRITDKGMERCRLICEKSMEIQETMLYGIAPEDRKRLAEALQTVLDNLKEEKIG